MKPEQQAQMDEFQRFLNECGEEMEVNSTPRKERMATPVKDETVTPAKDKTPTPTKDRLATPAKDRITTPVKEKSVPIVESQLSAKKRSLHMTELEEGTVKSVCREESDDSVLVTRKHRTIAFSDSEYLCLYQTLSYLF